ncbi:MAG: hypothetical protein ABSE73_14205 [Planctomycetota bacterium]
MPALKWELRELWRQGDAPATLALWGRSCGLVLQRNFTSVSRIYKEDLACFAGGDQRVKRRPWHRFMATLLYSLLWAWRGKVQELAALGMLPAWKTWMMLNCQPAGGLWHATPFVSGVTGKHCGTSVCPWCYLRRLDKLRKLAKQIGLGRVANLTMFWKRYPGPEFDPENYARMLHVCRRVVAEEREFSLALRTSTPVVGQDNARNTAFQFNLAFLHNRPFSSRERAWCCEGINVERYAGLPIYESLRIAAPYNLYLLSPEVSASTAFSVMRTMSNIRSFGVIGKKLKGESK